MDSHRALELVDAIYAAVFDPRDWQRVITLFDDVFPGARSVFGFYEAGLMNESLSAANVDPNYARTYYEHYNHVNPLVEVVATAKPGEVFDAGETLGRKAFLASEFYNDWLAPQGGLDGNTGVVLTASQSAFSVFCTHYPTRGEWRARKAEARTALELLAPHFRRALALRQRIEGAVMHAEALEQGFERLPDGVLVVSATARVHYLNRRAKHYLRRFGTLRIEPTGTLRLSNPAAQRALLAMLERAVNPRCDQNGAGQPPDSMRLVLDDEHYVVAQAFALSATVRTRSYATASPLGWEPKVVVFLVDPQRRPDCSEDVIAAVLGTTVAEARLARGLLQGKSLGGIAHEHGLKQATVRNQLQSLFDRTATHRQADLVALLQRAFSMAGEFEDF